MSNDAMSTGILSNRTAIVSGAGNGIGRGIALALAAAGANVVAAVRRQETGDETVAMIAAEGGVGLSVRTDIVVRADVDAMVAAAVARFGGVDIVIHNANSGTSSRPVRLEEITEALWDEQGAVALDGALFLAQAAYPFLKASDAARFLVLTSSQGLAGNGRNPAYAAFKGAQRGFVKALAQEWGPDQITVNAIAPTAESDGAAAYFAANPGVRERVESLVPLRRVGSPRDDVGDAVVALCSPYTRFVTGQTIGVNGGNYTAL